MKKAIFLLFILFSMNGIAQIDLIHSSSYEYGIVDYNGPKYVVIDNVNEKIDFYNPDFTFSDSINIDVPAEYDMAIYHYNITPYFSKHIFNLDENYEFPVVFSTLTGSYTYIYKILIINENGTTLKSFDNCKNDSFDIHEIDGEARLVIDRYINYPDEETTEYYSLPGNLESTKNNQKTDMTNAYTNPTNKYITLHYQIKKYEIIELNIFNDAGQLIETKIIGGAFNEIKLNVSNYIPGNYFYKYNNVTNKFIVPQ